MKKGNGKQLSEVGALTYLLIVSCLFFRPTEEIAKRESKQEQRNTRKLRRRSRSARNLPIGCTVFCKKIRTAIFFKTATYQYYGELLLAFNPNFFFGGGQGTKRKVGRKRPPSSEIKKCE
jgi:hypothetical protein